MPVINTKVLTTTDQGLTPKQKEQARDNIDAIKKIEGGTEGNIVVVGEDGNVTDSEVSIHVFRDVQADWADEAPDSPHHIKNKPEQLLADARVEDDVLVIDKLYGGESVEFSGMSAQEREKLEGIEEGAQVNVIEEVQVDGTALEVSGKVVNIPGADDVVKGVVLLTDDPDSEAAGTAATTAAIRAALANFGGFMIVELDPVTGKPDVENPSTKYIYLTKAEGSGKTDPYTEWIYVVPEQGEPGWEVIGETSVDLSGYVQKVAGATVDNLAKFTGDGSVADSLIAASDVSDAVDKRHAHSNKATLDNITAAYTAEEQSKLSGIDEGAQVNTIESISVSGTAVTPDANKNVNFVIPKAVPDPTAPNQMLFSVDGANWAPVTWEMEYFNAVVIGGKVYRTVKVGQQEWMAENLDFRFDYNGEPLPLNGNGTSNSPAAYYYDYDNNGTYAHGGSYNTGLLYNWHAANYLNTNRSTLCPGWHVPSESELSTLFTTVGGTSVAGKKLKYNSPTWASSWQGDDAYEFSALPSGVYDGNFTSLTSELRLWSTTESAGTPSYAQYAYFSNSNSVALNGVYKFYGCSIRLVKDSV